MKKIIVLLSVITSSITACAQKQQRITETSNPKTMDSIYHIGEYQLDPVKKTVSLRRTFSKGKLGTMMGYFPDEQIKYDSSSLVVLGNQVLFKEYFPKEVDFASLHYIGESDYSQDLYSDGHYVYKYQRNYQPGLISKVDISSYTRINDYVYEDKAGILYFLKTATENNQIKLEKIDAQLKVDKNTLTHLQGQYFADRNGLYAFGVRYFGHKYSNKFSQQPISILVESANGRDIKPIITRNYIVYGNSVYAKSHSIEKLKLDVTKMVEIKWPYQNIYFLTDGTNLYENRNSTYDEGGWNKDNSYANDFFKSGINLVKIFSPDMKSLQAKDKNTLYFTNVKTDIVDYSDKSGILIKTDQGYYFANAGSPDVKPDKIDKIIIYNQQTKQNENFDDSEYLYIDNGIFAYKGYIFFNNIPLKEINGAKNLRFFTQNGIKTNFVTSGDMLIAFGNIGGYQTEMINGEEKVVFDKWIKTRIDVTKLKAINKNLLVDDANFYDCSNGSLQIIPFKKLDMPVKLLLPTAPQQYDF